MVHTCNFFLSSGLQQIERVGATFIRLTLYFWSVTVGIVVVLGCLLRAGLVFCVVGAFMAPVPFSREKRESLRRRSHYIIFVSREEDGTLRKIPIPLRYAYIFLAAAVVGLFTIMGLAGSYSRMLLKTAHYNQVRDESANLRKDYLNMARVAHEKDVQAASLGSLASEVSALYGLEQSRHARAMAREATAESMSNQQYHASLNQFLALRSSALSGEMARRLDFRERFPSIAPDLSGYADAPNLWPIQGVVTSSFGERLDPFEGEGAFHTGIDIATAVGTPVHATADGVVIKASMGTGYGREVILDHGHGIETLYAHLSGYAVAEGQEVRRGDVIGYVGSSGRSTGPHLHYEVRIHNTPVNPHKYLRDTMLQFAAAQADANADAVGGGQ